MLPPPRRCRDSAVAIAIAIAVAIAVAVAIAIAVAVAEAVAVAIAIAEAVAVAIAIAEAEAVAAAEAVANWEKAGEKPRLDASDLHHRPQLASTGTLKMTEPLGTTTGFSILRSVTLLDLGSAITPSKPTLSQRNTQTALLKRNS